MELCELALEHGLLPHTNAGLLAEEDLIRLQPYNASMGLMLESTAIWLSMPTRPERGLT